MIRIENLTKGYAAKTLFQNTTYHFPEAERVALVGPNGAGKSTLLNIICGIDEADSGQILKPAKVNLGYLPQEPNAHPKATLLEECVDGAIKLRELKKQLDHILEQMEENYSEEVHKKYEKIENDFREAGGYALEARAKGILLGLGFQDFLFSKNPKELSGGWRMRLELARVFLNDPDFLVLDEPTNHLDLPSLIWVEKFLQSFQGTLLFVSHDRALLNRLSTVTLHLNNGKLTPYKGNFDSFLEQREHRLELEAAQADRLKKRMEEVQRFVDRFKAKASKAKQAQSRVKMLARMKELEGTFDLDNAADEISFSLPKTIASGKEVLTIEKLSIGYDKVLSKDIHLKVTRGQKIAIIGPNGIGKSTLLKTISENIRPYDGSFELGHNVSLAFFAQDQLDVLDEKLSILENVMRSSAHVSERRARSLLGSFLFRRDDVFKPVKVLSGGEKSRVGLACLLLQEANFLLLDEPTNHLDMSSAEILAQAIDDYEGTVLFVSHDRNFIDCICTHVFAMTNDGRFALFEGKLEDYERLAPLSGFPDILSPDKSLEVAKISDEYTKPIQAKSSDNSREQQQENKKEKLKLEKMKEKIDADILDISEKIKKITTEMESVDHNDYKRLTDLNKQHENFKSLLIKAEEDCLEIEEKLSDLT